MWPFWVGYYSESRRFKVGAMGSNFLPRDHDQPYLLPSDIREWLSADHKVWALVEARRPAGFPGTAVSR